MLGRVPLEVNWKFISLLFLLYICNLTCREGEVLLYIESLCLKYTSLHIIDVFFTLVTDNTQQLPPLLWGHSQGNVSVIHIHTPQPCDRTRSFST
jgi:hypothetical protein